MYLEAARSCTGVLALFANEGLFPCMDPHVLFKMITSYAGVVALFANNRCLSTVNKIVSFQIRSFNACVAALLATVCFWIFIHIEEE